MTEKEIKNGQGPPPLKTEYGWIYLAHGGQENGCRISVYTLPLYYLPGRAMESDKKPSGHFLEPLDGERVGDVSNMVFGNGWIANNDGMVFVYYASSDTRIIWQQQRWKN